MERISGYITRVRGFPNCWLLDYESYIASYSSILPTVCKLYIAYLLQISTVDSAVNNIKLNLHNAPLGFLL